jgi:hypothetical protein
MKNLTTILALTLSLGSLAQSSIQLINKLTTATLAPNAIIKAKTGPDSLTKVTIDIKNTSNSTKSYRAIRYDKVLHATPNATAQAYFCIAGTCYPADTDTSEAVLTLNANQRASEITGDYQMLEADLYEADTRGFSHVKYTFYNVADPSDSVQVSIQYNDLTTGVNEVEGRQLVKLYPNPSPDGRIAIDHEGKVQVTVFNLLGARVHSEHVNSGDKLLDLSSLPTGAYFIRLETGGRALTEKLVISK